MSLGRVLLVDDDELYCLGLQNLLSASGVDCDLATSAEEARAKLAAAEYHLALIDLLLGGDRRDDLLL